MAITADQFDKILDRLPFLDGSGRRRFVAGGIILIGIAVPNWDALQNALPLEKVQAGDILTSPIIAAGAMLLVYAIGSLADMLGELFLVRAASGVFWALGWPGRVVKIKHKALRTITLILLTIIAVPYIAYYYILHGLIGRTHYEIDLPRILSPRAQDLYEALPEKVAEGLRMPVGDASEGALKYVVDQFQSEADRKWARRLVLRAKDVAATITALQVVLFYIIFAGAGLPSGLGMADLPKIPAAVEVNSIVRQITGLYPDAYRDFDTQYLNDKVNKNLPITSGYLRFVNESIQRLTKISDKEFLESRLGTEKDREEVLRLAVKLRDQVSSYNQEVEKWQNIQSIEQAKQTALFALLGLPFLFLYLGFFTILRNAITAILQALAMSSPAPASDAPSET